MSDDVSPPAPPAPPIEDRRFILALAEASEAVSFLALAALAANPMVRTDRMGRARIGFDLAVHRLNELLGNVLPARDEPQVIRPLEREGVP